MGRSEASDCHGQGAAGPDTHAAVHAGGMGQEQAVNCLAGDQQDDQVALHLAEVNAAREERAALDAQADSIVQQVDV